MNAIVYREERIKRGSQSAVAKALGVTQNTISRRETGSVPVTREAWLSLRALPETRAATTK